MRSLFYFLKKLHAYSGRILYLNLFGSMLMGLLDSIGILLLIPLLSIIGIVDGSMTDISGLNIFIPLQEISQETALLMILGLYLLIVFGQTLISRNLGLREIRIHTGFINHIRLELYQALLKANWEFFISRRKSDLINSLTTELGRVTNSTFLLLQLLASIVFTTIQVIIAMIISFKLTLFVLGCGLVIALLSRRFIKKSGELGNVMNELSQSYLAGISDHFNGIKDIKSNLLEVSRYQWLTSWSDRIAAERFENARIRSNSKIMYKLFSTVMIAGFIYGSFKLFPNQGFTLLLIIAIFSRLWPRFTGIQSSLENIASSLHDVRKIMTLTEDCRNAEDLGGLINVNKSFKGELKFLKKLECYHVNFRYNPRQKDYTLNDINLRIHANQMTAIVGRSGAGKSTLIDLIMGLIKPESGKILIDGQELTDQDLLNLRSSISYVPQDPFLFHGTVRENLLMINSEARDEDMWEAIEFSSAAEIVHKLPNGLDTIIGDRGIRLSGGERQRLVLARAILKKPKVLILDEATSALDTVNEAKIQKAIERLKGTMTVIVIAHRLSTIRNADQIVVLENGNIVQAGEYEILSKDKSGLFSELLGSQLKISSF
ncbi:ABC transporter ATP-binding protein [Bacillus sp. PS06]|uniref:ABC transporter ATP-binding protein n=1 Tax=Bacillus sp. PS06 TaxID=2764176 RepID=UPI001784D212|nr:ABC transporter ATP-binding protein [Bacillus sp. PS06]MBD8071110.1 ABC transporter ATP-binding protein [Bacillus sp. PS06]